MDKAELTFVLLMYLNINISIITKYDKEKHKNSLSTVIDV